MKVYIVYGITWYGGEADNYTVYDAWTTKEKARMQINELYAHYPDDDDDGIEYSFSYVCREIKE